MDSDLYDTTFEKWKEKINICLFFHNFVLFFEHT